MPSLTRHCPTRTTRHAFLPAAAASATTTGRRHSAGVIVVVTRVATSPCIAEPATRGAVGTSITATGVAAALLITRRGAVATVAARVPAVNTPALAVRVGDDAAFRVAHLEQSKAQ